MFLQPGLDRSPFVLSIWRMMDDGSSCRPCLTYTPGGPDRKQPERHRTPEWFLGWLYGRGRVRWRDVTGRVTGEALLVLGQSGGKTRNRELLIWHIQRIVLATEVHNVKISSKNGGCLSFQGTIEVHNVKIFSKYSGSMSFQGTLALDPLLSPSLSAFVICTSNLWPRLDS